MSTGFYKKPITPPVTSQCPACKQTIYRCAVCLKLLHFKPNTMNKGSYCSKACKSIAQYRRRKGIPVLNPDAVVRDDD